MTPSGSKNSVSQEVIRCATWADFVDRCSDDIARGGMYIQTSAPHAVSSIIDVQLCLPGGHDVHLQGYVVHVMDAADAADKRMHPGIGVEFVGLDGQRAAELRELLRYARTEGSRQAPRYSFATWLSTTAQSQTPAGVMASLPPPSDRSLLPRRRRHTGQHQTGHRRRTDSSGPATQRSESATSTVRMRQVTPKGAPTADRGAPDTAPLPAPEPSRARPPHATRNPPELKLAMTHLAHRRYVEAELVFGRMLAADPLDRDAQLWMHICCAREANAQDRLEAAVTCYRKVLVVDQRNREALLKIKTLQRNLRLKSLPFGRFFSKK